MKDRDPGLNKLPKFDRTLRVPADWISRRALVPAGLLDVISSWILSERGMRSTKYLSSFILHLSSFFVLPLCALGVLCGYSMRRQQP
jgi:hypothetical protein